MISCSINPERLRRSRELFTAGASGELSVLHFHLESAQLVFQRLLGGFTTFQANIDPQRAKLLNQSISYTTERINELLLRLSFIDWVHRQFVATPQYPSGLWNYYSTLAVKDFHVDAAALMDSMAPVAIQIDTELSREDRTKLPGLPDIQHGTKRTYRERMSTDLLDLIDQTDLWWPYVKRLRDLIVHREHLRLVFGKPENGFRFQLYAPTDTPLITEPILCDPNRTVDFFLYSTWVTAEIIFFLDAVGHLMFSRFSIPAEALTYSGRISSFGPFLGHLDQLLVRAQAANGS